MRCQNSSGTSVGTDAPTDHGRAAHRRAPAAAHPQLTDPGPSKRLLVLAALTGLLTGVCVAGFEWVTRSTIFDWVLTLPLGPRP